MKAINWDILMVFAGSVVLGLAIQKTGIAERLAFGILEEAQGRIFERFVKLNDFVQGTGLGLSGSAYLSKAAFHIHFDVRDHSLSKLKFG